MSDPNAITAMVIRQEVVSVDAEDLNNGVEPNESYDFIRELPSGGANLLGSGNEPGEPPTRKRGRPRKPEPVA